MKNRRERYLRSFLNVPLDVAIKSLVAINDDRVLHDNEEVYHSWKLKSKIEFLRRDDETMCDDTSCHKDVENWLSTFRKPDFMTSFDCMVRGTRLNYRCRSKSGAKWIHKSLLINPFNFHAYIEIMESFNYKPVKPILSILRNFLLALHYCNIEMAMIQHDLEKYDDTDVLTEELKEVIGFHTEFRSFLIMMRSEYPNTGIFEFRCTAQRLQELIEYGHPGLLLHLSFILTFCANNSEENLRNVLSLLNKCIACCTAIHRESLIPYAFCAMALIYVNLGETQKSLSALDKALTLVPNMYRALELRCQINITNQNLKPALDDNSEILALQPEQPCQISKIYASRAMIYSLMGNPQEAKETFQKALEYDINNTTCQIALLYNALENNDENQFEKLVADNVSRMTQAPCILRVLSIVAAIYRHFNKQMNTQEYYIIWQDHGTE